MKILPTLRDCCLLASLLAASVTGAAEPTAAKLFPETTALYAEVDVERTVDTIVAHPLLARLQEIDAYNAVLKSEELKPVRAVIRAIETDLKHPLPEVAKRLTDGGLSVGVDAESNGIALLAKTSEPELAKRFRQVLLTFLRGTAQLAGKPDPVEELEYRGVQAHSVGDVGFGIIGPWIVVVHGDLGEHLVDALLDGPERGLADNPRFQASQKTQHEEWAVWSFADVAALRERNVFEKLLRERSDNPFVDLLLGGLLTNLGHTPWATGTLDITNEQLGLSLTSPHDAKWSRGPKAFYFGEDGEGQAPAVLLPEGTILSVSTYRDLASMWLHADDLFTQDVNDQLAQLDSGLATFFAGKDFGEDVLGAIRGGMQFVVTRQDFTDRLPQPAIKLPAFAGVFQLYPTPGFQDDFRRTFQSLLGFLNVLGAMEGQPQLDFWVEKKSGTQLLRSFFVAEPEVAKSREAPLQFNFSPTATLQESRMVLSSTTPLARSLENAKVLDHEPGTNTHAVLSARALHAVLQDNREQLISQNMVEDGNTREEAAGEIDVLLGVLNCFEDASFKLGSGRGQLSLQLRVRFQEPSGP